MRLPAIIFAIAATAITAPAQAEIVESEHGGFASTNSVLVAADRAAVWRALVHPEDWWSHSWSGDSANLRLDPQAGGCFCEVLPAADGWPSGSAEHMRVLTVMPGTMLRMSGALGPLQSEALAGTLTVTLFEQEEGTLITWDYITGGESRFALETFGPLVDGVQAEFLGELAAQLGGAIEQP